MNYNTFENIQELISEKPKMTPKTSGFGVRHIQFALLFLACTVAYGIRTILSVAIVAMTSTTPPNKNIPVYPEWQNKDIVLSSFFWGYVCTQIAAGQIAKNYGPKKFLAGAIFINAVATLVVPWMAAWLGSYGVMGCRVIQGLSQGFLFPSLHNLLAKWTPLGERSRVATYVYAGGPLGTMIAMPITGYISNSSSGWPVVFFLYGALGTLWALLFFFIGSNSPEEHGSISEDEKNYIQQNNFTDDSKSKVKTPWKSILTSVPFFAILVAHCGQNWAFWTLLNCIPSYMDGIMKFDMESNGLLSALPYLVLCLLSFAISPIADLLIRRKICSIGTTRKIFNTIGKIIPALALVALGFTSGDKKELAISLLVISVGVNAAIYCGFNVNHIDLSPVHAGTLMGITNCFSNMFSLAAPLFMQAIIDNHEDDPARWRTIFLTAAGFLTASDIFYVIFASGEIQPWNSVEDHKETAEPQEAKAEQGTGKDAVEIQMKNAQK